MTSKIIACLDGSGYADSVLDLAAWAADRCAAPLALLHAAAPHGAWAGKADLSGQIGLGAKSELLEELAQLDEERGKLEQKKGQLILRHAEDVLGGRAAEVLHRRGSLLDCLTEIEAQAELIVLGKRGEHAGARPDHIGGNLERLARSLRRPLLIAPEARADQPIGPVKRLLIAYDGSRSCDKAVQYVAEHRLLAGLDCHLLKVGDASDEATEILDRAHEKLQVSGADVCAAMVQAKSVPAAVADYAAHHRIDLLAIGAYGHSRLRELLIGSTTTVLIAQSAVPVLLFR